MATGIFKLEPDGGNIKKEPLPDLELGQGDLCQAGQPSIADTFSTNMDSPELPDWLLGYDLFQKDANYAADLTSQHQNSSSASLLEVNKCAEEPVIQDSDTSTPIITTRNDDGSNKKLPETEIERHESRKQEQSLSDLPDDGKNGPITNHTVAPATSDQGLTTTKKRRKKRGPRRRGGRTVTEMFCQRYETVQKSVVEASAGSNKTQSHDSGKKRKLSHVTSQGGSGGNGLGIIQQLVTYNAVAASKRHGDHEQSAKFTASTQKAQFENLLKNFPESSDKRKARGELEALKEVVRKFGQHTIKPVDGKWLLRGMSTSLFGYQLIGVAWMIERELSLDSPDGPLGGICADAMGLGKTVEAIATMVANPPGADVPMNRRSTLIVVPSSIKWQWNSEIEKHAKDAFPRIAFYRASEKIQTIRITDCDIVLTTWKELSKSCPFPDKATYNQLLARIRKKHNKPEDDESTPIEEWIANNTEKQGQLHEIYWYRIILDESHNIKNHLCRQSLASRSLKGKYRWALSGTPIMNRLEEFYPYFQFLKHPSAASYRSFKLKFCGRNEGGLNHPLDVLLAKYMLRRTTGDSFLGRPIVYLPPPTESTVTVKFSSEENILYRAFEDRMRQLFNQSFERGDERKNLTYLFPQLIRLRQFTAHPLVLEKQMKIAFEIDHLREVQKQIMLLPSADLTLYNRVTDWIESKKLEVDLTDSETENAYNCMICSDLADDPLSISIKKCGHTFCRSCIEDKVEHQIESGQELPYCPECNTMFDPETSLKSLHSGVCGSRHTTTARKGKDALKFHPDVQGSYWLEQYDMGKAPLFESTKLKAVMEQISLWLKDAPSDKIIIFTQWRKFAAVIGRALEEERISFVYYTGDKEARKRNIAVQKFEFEPSIKIMIAGLSCGGVGLNLACANRVINVDPWWNTCIEQQAFGRVYRIPQPKNTYYVRMVVKNSVDARISKLQVKKENIVDPRMKGKATVEEIAGLFGRVVVDENGITRVERDYSDDESDSSGESDSDDYRELNGGSDSDYLD